MRYNNIYKDYAYKGIKELIENGIKALNPEPFDLSPDVKAQSWLQYSDKFVDIFTKDLDTSIHLNYLRLLLSLQGNYNMPINQKINICLEYLLEVLRLISEHY
jgi:hypothetical protein